MLARSEVRRATAVPARVEVDGIEHFTCLTQTGIVTPEKLAVELATSGITLDQTLGVDASQVPPLDRMPPGIRGVLKRLGLDLETFQAT